MSTLDTSFGGGAGPGPQLSGGAWSANMNISHNSMGLSQAAGSNTTLAVINQFKLEAARSIRTSTIILATFNTISAFATALGIWYDCYSSARRNRRPSQRVSAFTCVQGPETFPFVLSVGIVIQGIIFAVSQAQGLDGLFAKGCSLISQFMWPAIFIVPYLQLVFGVEVTLRAVRSKPFPPRGNWAVAICLAVFCLMLLATGLVAFFIRAANFCFASLFWFVTKWAEGGFVLFTLVSVVLAVCTVTVFIQLTRHATIETTERVIASRMVYFLGVALVSNVLMIPFFLCLTVQMPGGGADSDMTLTLSMISTVVANISGLLTGGLHLFLRSNTIATISPRDKQAEYERQKLKYKIGGPTLSEENFSNQINRPIDGPRILKRSPSEDSFVLPDQALEEAAIESPPQTAFSFHFDQPNPLRSHAVHPEPSPRAPEPAPLPSVQAPVGHARKPSASYSLFPNKPTANTNTESVALLLPTTYTPNDTANMGANTNPFSPAAEDFDDDLLKPPMAGGFGRHRRDSSRVSMATVQIGLRFSNVNDMPPMDKSNDPNRVTTLECPAPTRPSPLSKFAVRSEELSPARPSVFDNSQATLGGTAAALPQVPPSASLKEEVAEEAAPEDLFTLKPAVYSPNSPTKVKVPSPRGVGFNVPKRSNTNPMHHSPSPSPTPSPRSRGNSDAAAESKSDWI